MKKSKTAHPTSHTQERRARLTHQAFFPLLIFTLILWFLYRRLFDFSVVFDETIGKFVFFGLPVWLYISVTGYLPIRDAFAPAKLRPGLLKGLAVGGLFGFLVLLLRAVLTPEAQFQALALFAADRFWLEFMLALLTGFWETLFFFAWIQLVIEDRFSAWTLRRKLVLVAIIFVLFHIPNIFLRFPLEVVISLLSLLGLFALGQAYLFHQSRNGYMLVLSQAFWGLALLVHF